MEYVGLDRIVKELKWEVVYKASDFEDVKIYSSEIIRPGLQMVGYYDKYSPERLQIMGSAEWYYYNELDPELRYESIDKLFSYPIPCMVLSRDLPVFPELILLAKKHNRTILRTNAVTSKLINQFISFVDLMLAPEITLNGVLIEVYGMGVLIVGKSGVGKSETALDLVIRGHRLVSDDLVNIKIVEEGLRGEAPELTRHFMEIRGIGILDIERLYGVSAVKHFEYIDLVVELETWDAGKEYDRIGLEEEYMEILDMKVTKVTVPVRPGRNIGMIVEVAVRNYRQKGLGYNAAEELNNKIIAKIHNRKKELDK
jgi:HPr kinase/phosphorylase